MRDAVEEPLHDSGKGVVRVCPRVLPPLQERKRAAPIDAIVLQDLLGVLGGKGGAHVAEAMPHLGEEGGGRGG